MIVNITLCKENQENVDSLYSALLTGLVKEFDRRIPIRPKRGIKNKLKSDIHSGTLNLKINGRRLVGLKDY